MNRRFKTLLVASLILCGLVLPQSVQAHPPAAGTAWQRLSLVSQKKANGQLICRYARTGENRRQLLTQEAVAVFRLPKTNKRQVWNCPRPTPGRTNLNTLAAGLRRHRTLGKLLVKVTVLPARSQS